MPGLQGPTGRRGDPGVKGDAGQKGQRVKLQNISELNRL